MSKTTQNDWAERFDKEFPNLRMYYSDGLAPCEDDVKAFIAKELADARKEVMMDIRKLRYELVVTGEGTCFANEYIKGQTYLSLETLEKCLATLRKESK